MTNYIQYHDIGRIQLGTAIRLYEEENYICAITLGKAAEEFLGKPLGEGAALKSLQTKVPQELHGDLNKVSVFLKHGASEKNASLCEQEVHVRMEAIQYILRGITNYSLLVGGVTSGMQRFAEAHTSENIDLIIEDMAQVS